MQQYSKFLISNRWSKSARGFAALILIVSDDGILLVVACTAFRARVEIGKRRKGYYGCSDSIRLT